MSEGGELRRAIKSLETVRRAKELLPTFYRKQAPKQAGGALAWAMVGISPEILYAFDLPTEWPENFGSLCASKQVSTGFIEQAEADGYSSDLCSYLLNNMGYASRMVELGAIPPEAPKGGMGVPTMLLGAGFACDPRSKWFPSVSSSYLKNVPVFTFDMLSPPHDADVADPGVRTSYTGLLRQSLHDLIAFISTQTGRSIDLARLRYALELSHEQSVLMSEINELRAAVPCPMGAEDFFSGCVIPMTYITGEVEAVDYLRRMRDEVRERVAQGIGVLPDERYRLMWIGLPPWYNLGFFNAIGELGAVFPVETIYNPGPAIDIDLSDPVEAIVERTWQRAVWVNSWGSEHIPESSVPCNYSPAGSRLVTSWVKKFKIDGAVMHRTRTCRAVSWGQVHIKNLLAEEGVPSLIIESDMGDPRSWDQSAIMAQVRGLLSTIDSARKTGGGA